MTFANAAGTRDGRDVGLDVFRGVANWAIFLDHIPVSVPATAS